MFNLLPDNLKAQIKKEYTTRFVVTVLVFVVVLQCLCLALLFPSWFVSRTKEEVALSDTDNTVNSQFLKDASSVTSIIVATNLRLGYIANTLDYPEVEPLIDGIIKSKSSSITLDQFTYTDKDKKTATISIGGISATRESLISFVKKLQDSGMFKAVNLPISNLAKDKNINFTIDLQINT